MSVWWHHQPWPLKKDPVHRRKAAGCWPQRIPIPTETKTATTALSTFRTGVRRAATFSKATPVRTTRTTTGLSLNPHATV